MINIFLESFIHGVHCYFQEKKKQLEEQLPAEPDAGAKDVATIRLRCPDGTSLVRRFLGDDKLEVESCNSIFIIFDLFIFIL